MHLWSHRIKKIRYKNDNGKAFMTQAPSNAENATQKQQNIMRELNLQEPAPYLIQGEKDVWEVVIGMEVHAQISSKAKLFSGASTEFGADENSNVSLVDAAFPGMLPVINEYCVTQAIKTGYALNAQINKYSVFDRKNYFYPDLPQGYQISQFTYPIIGEGHIVLDFKNNIARYVGIERLHLEQDAGKSIHDQHPSMSFIDLNRSGTALMEIVTKPDIRSPEEAGAFMSKLRTILRYIGTCDGNMEQGSMRADVNVSVRRQGDPLGTRCEIKNVNSVKFIKQAAEIEAKRQIQVLENGGIIDQETRLFDPKNAETRTMRSKEDAHDYRYFPDPDLLPVQLSQEQIDEAISQLPELPDVRKLRFIKDFNLSLYDANVLTADKDNADYFEKVAIGRDAKLASVWVINELFGALNKQNLDITNSPISAVYLGEMVDLISDNTISGKIGKQLFEIMWTSDEAPIALVEKHGLRQVTDFSAIEKVIDEVIADSPDNVAAFKAGKVKLIGWFVGQVMKKTGGKASPDAVNEMLQKKLS
ncbi:MAG: aspartyl-tRNA(Asn)/glutamyl-tRNA(Gln) amidotransferase subunit B [Alphaproteobacteria bacterium]